MRRAFWRKQGGDAGRRRFRFEPLEPRLALDATGLRITEFMADNEDGIVDFEGDASDWIEIYNPGTQEVDLSGLYLSDNRNNLTKWQFPSGVSLEAGEYLIVWASSKDGVYDNGELHANFALSADGEYLGLVAADGQTVIDAYHPKFPAQFEDISYGVAMEPVDNSITIVGQGAQARALIPSDHQLTWIWQELDFDDSAWPITGPTGIGYEKTPGHAHSYTSLLTTYVPTNTTSLYVRMEFELESLVGLDELTLRMKYSDGFVAFLNGVEIAEKNAITPTMHNSVASANHDRTDALQWEEFVLDDGAGMLRLGKNVLAFHALNVAGSSNMLLMPELVASSRELLEAAPRGYLGSPTPGYGNDSTAVLGFAAEPSFSVPHGFYDTPQSVELKTTTPGSIIVYTTNGSMPIVDDQMNVVNGTLYTQPIEVAGTTNLRARAFRDGYAPSSATASTYLFLDDIIHQPEAPLPGWPADGLNGQYMDYGIDPEIVALYGEQAVKDSLQALSVFSLTFDLDDMFHPDFGIYVNAEGRGKEWERHVNVEFIDPANNTGFEVNAGLRIRGNSSRADWAPKHSFRFVFRNAYGDGKLRFPMFGDLATDDFNVLDLQTAQGLSWSNESSFRGEQHTFVRDIFSRDLQRDMGHITTHGRYHHLFLNGVYWGIYLTQERVEEDYAVAYFGGNEEDYDIVKADPSLKGVDVVAGTDIAWRQLFEYGEALAADPEGNADLYWTMQGLNPDGTRNELLPVLLDVENLIDYMLIVFYTGGFDIALASGGLNRWSRNWIGLYNHETEDEGFQFFIHDNELSMGAGLVSLHQTIYINRTGPFRTATQSDYAQANPQFLHQDLLDHPEYRQKFVDRVEKHFYNGGVLTDPHLVTRFAERAAQVEGGIIAEAARWGDAKTDVPRTKATWDAEIAWILNFYFPERRAHALSQLRGDDLHRNFSAPILSQHGGVVPQHYPLTLSAAGGTIYYTLDGVTDPRTIGGGVNPDSAVSVYSGPITLQEGATIRARLRTNSGQWSGLVEATFQVVNMPGDYNGSGTVDTDDYQLWKSSYGQVVSPYDGADGNGDGIVNTLDFVVWRNNLGNTAPAAVAGGTEAAGGESGGAVAIAAAPVMSPEFLAQERHQATRRGALADTALAASASADGREKLLLLAETAAREEEAFGEWRPARRVTAPSTDFLALDTAFALELEEDPWGGETL